MSDLGKASNVEGDIDASEQSEIQPPCEDQQGVKDNSPGAESAIAHAANANETGLHKTESVAKAEGTKEDMKTEESAAESSEVKESSVEGGDQKKRFVIFCLLEQKMAVRILLLWLLC